MGRFRVPVCPAGAFPRPHRKEEMQQTARFRQKAVLAALVFGLWCVAACSQPVVKPPGWPSVVVTEARVTYYIMGLKLPGTSQELRARRADSSLWIPLKDMAALRFSGPLKPDDYRRARVVLHTGEILEVEVFTRCLIEGNLEAGYWNMPLSQVSHIEFGRD